VDILQEILQRKSEEIRRDSEQLSLRKLSKQLESASPVRGFVDALKRRFGHNQAGVIAEIKKASPSKGVLRESFDPAAIADDYARHGADCLSVLTDEDFFQGSLAYLQAVRDVCALPLLRKDFIIDPYQIYQARKAGADCVLLIVAALGDADLGHLCELAMELGMDVLMEVHDGGELERALQTPAEMIGINNRNLRTFQTDIQTTLNLIASVPEDRLLVTESGIHDPQQVQTLWENGAGAFLVGEAFMKAPSPGEALAQLFARVR